MTSYSRTSFCEAERERSEQKFVRWINLRGVSLAHVQLTFYFPVGYSTAHTELLFRQNIAGEKILALRAANFIPGTFIEILSPPSGAYIYS